MTFTIPKANIFSGIEPCLAVVLASVPMMRPLLSRSAATPYGPSQRPVNTDHKCAGPKGMSDDGFERLEEDINHLWLRPMGLQHRADACALRETIVGNASEGDEELLDKHEVGDETNGRGIKVKQSFQVSVRG